MKTTLIIQIEIEEDLQDTKNLCSKALKDYTLRVKDVFDPEGVLFFESLSQKNNTMSVTGKMLTRGINLNK